MEVSANANYVLLEISSIRVWAQREGDHSNPNTLHRRNEVRHFSMCGGDPLPNDLRDGAMICINRGGIPPLEHISSSYLLHLILRGKKTEFEKRSSRAKGLTFHPKKPRNLTNFFRGVIQQWYYLLGSVVLTLQLFFLSACKIGNLFTCKKLFWSILGSKEKQAHIDKNLIVLLRVACISLLRKHDHGVIHWFLQFRVHKIHYHSGSVPRLLIWFSQFVQFTCLVQMKQEEHNMGSFS
ncbi:hypothetical protein YC2023_092028 [Brassica napus]